MVVHVIVSEHKLKEFVRGIIRKEMASFYRDLNKLKTKIDHIQQMMGIEEFKYAKVK